MLVFTAGVLLELVHSLQVAGSSVVLLVLTAGVLLVLEVQALQVWGSELLVLVRSAGVEELAPALEVLLSLAEAVLVV